MNRIICWLKTAHYSIPQILKGSYPIEGHSYYETYRNKDVHILKCMDCGKYSIGYYNGGEPKPNLEDKPDVKSGGLDE